MKTLLNANFSQPNMPVIATSTVVASAPASSGSTSSSSTPFPLATFGANLVAWFKADTGTVGPATAITGWTDQSQYATSLITGSAGSVAPVLTANGVASGSGVTFGGATGKYFAASAADISVLKFTGETALCIAFAYKFNNTAASGQVFGSSNFSNSTGWYVFENAGKVGIAFLNSATNNYLIVGTTTALTAGQSYIVQIAYSGSGTGAGVVIAIDGAVVPVTIIADSLASNNVSSSTGQYFQVGGGQGNGATANPDCIGEIVIVNRALTNTEATGLSAYLDGRYKIY